MSTLHTQNLILQNVTVPLALLASPDRFGGQIAGDCRIGDLRVLDGRVAGMLQPGEAVGAAHIYDLAGQMVIPLLTEAHCHLDKCHTISRLGPIGGDLHTAIDAQSRDKRLWSEADLRRRASRGLTELQHSGCAAVRTHVDWEMEYLVARQAPLAWAVLGDLASEWADDLLLQRSALMPIEAFAAPELAEAAVRFVAQSDNTVLGIFVFNQPEKRTWLHTAFELAAKYDLPIDIHVDEGLAANLDGLEAIADLVLATGFTRPVLCGHACSLSNLTGADLERVLEQVAHAKLNLVALPMTNLYLQDRQAGTPQRRGITRIRELTAAGIPVALASDNVGDAFYPLGNHDPMAALAAGVMAAHLDPPCGQWLPMITTAARHALGLDPLAVDQATLTDLLVSQAQHTADLVAGAARQPLAAFLQHMHHHSSKP